MIHGQQNIKREDVLDNKWTGKQRTDINLEGWLKYWDMLNQKREDETEFVEKKCQWEILGCQTI
jgi:hypothetical protein